MRPARWLPKAIVAAVFGALAAYALLFRVTMPGARHAVLWIILLEREHDGKVRRPIVPLQFVPCNWRAGATSSSNESTVLIGTIGGSNEGSKAANARSLALHGMPQPPERMIVIARTTQETGWLHLQFGGIPVAVYQAVANLTEHRERCPRGKFAGPLGLCRLCDAACECAGCCRA
jgi:hypothetical protein